MEWIESLRQFDAYEDPNAIKYIDFHTLVSPTKGRMWINDGKEHALINPEDKIPEGWVLGRVNVHKDTEKFRTQGLTNNSNKKIWQITYRDGSTEIVTQLNSWCRREGYSISAIKGMVRRFRLGRKRTTSQDRYNHIESIVEA